MQLKWFSIFQLKGHGNFLAYMHPSRTGLNERIWHVLYEIRYFPFARRKQSTNLRRGRAPYLPAGSDGLSKIWQKCVFLRARHSTRLFAWQWEMSRSSTGHLAGSCFAGTSIPEQDTNALLFFSLGWKTHFILKPAVRCCLLFCFFVYGLINR